MDGLQAANANPLQLADNSLSLLISYYACRSKEPVKLGAPDAATSRKPRRRQVPVYGHVQCGGCSIMLMYPLGAQSVKCSVCHFVTNVCQPANWTPNSSSAPPGPVQQRPAAMPKPLQTVVVENPPSLDDQGNEVANIAVAVKDNNS
eukprot:gene5854-6095_t